MQKAPAKLGLFQMEPSGSALFLLRKWAMQESNLRLPPCEDGTLAAELIAL
jgi:hypothetical protein